MQEVVFASVDLRVNSWEQTRQTDLWSNTETLQIVQVFWGFGHSLSQFF